MNLDRLRSQDDRAGSGRPGEGLLLLIAIIALMWLVEVVNTIDHNLLDGDGLHARDLSRLWGILTSPFIHASFGHLLGNTVPFLFLGVIIALRGAARLAIVTGFVIVVGGFGTWLIAPSNTVTVGASGVVFGYATYLLTRGFFDRSLLEIVIGLVVGAVWGTALVSSLIPHTGVSWQGHLCGGLAGVLVAWRLSHYDRRRAAAHSGAGFPSGTGTVARPRTAAGR